jgi:uncharacterized protein YqeY
MLYDDLNVRLKEALRNGDVTLKNAIRNIKTRLSEYLVEHRMSHDSAPDAVVTDVIAAHRRSLEKAMEQFRAAGDKGAHLVSEYEAEIGICKGYLPDESVAEDTIRQLVDTAVAELGVSGAKAVGKVVGHVMRTRKDLDGKTVKRIAAERLGA